MKATLSDQMYLRLKTDIEKLEIDASDFINEQSIAARYQSSVAPVRSALHRLCSEGILVSYPRKGYLIVTLNKTDYKQVMELREINECYALELLSKSVTKEQLGELMKLAIIGSTIESNAAFHLALAEYTGNKYLKDIVHRLLSLVSRTLYAQRHQIESQDLTTAHRAIVEGLLDGDLEKARQALIADIR